MEISVNSECEGIDTVSAMTVPPPQIETENISACVGDTARLNAKPMNIDNQLSTYAWMKDNKPLPDTTPQLKPVVGGLYSVKFSLGECSVSENSKVKFNPVPFSNMVHLVKFCQEDDQQVSLNGGNAKKYYWVRSKDSTKTIVATEPGYYPLFIFNEFNCKTADSILVKDLCPPKVFIPNAINPSKPEDENFKVFGRRFKNYSLTIFSRWGEIIFYSTNRNDVWNGMYRGELMPIGVYNYMLQYEGEDEGYKGPYKIQGTITIVE